MFFVVVSSQPRTQSPPCVIASEYRQARTSVSSATASPWARSPVNLVAYAKIARPCSS
jgi:hypothetical protein